MHELITAVGSGCGLPDEQVRYAFALALEQAVCEYYGISECPVDLEDKIVAPAFQEFSEKECENLDQVYPELLFSELPKNIINRCRQLFSENLVSMETVFLYEKWTRKIHQAVEGVICDVEDDRIWVRLEDNTRGVMLKPEWVPAEVPIYWENGVLWFYVTKVIREQSTVTVYLSRGSKNFPAAMIKKKCPWLKIQAKKRIRGKKTWIKSSAGIDQKIIRALQRELKGEIIVVSLDRL
ncbi:MAG: hypothetical protein R2860_07900 [Desulfobacterales bacterium]